MSERSENNGYYELSEISEPKPYRETNLLESEGLLDIKRGKYNKILLSPEGKAVLESFLEFNENYESLPLAVSEFKSKRLESQLESERERKQALEGEVKNLRNKLVLVRKPWYKQALVRVRNWLDRLI